MDWMGHDTIDGIEVGDIVYVYNQQRRRITDKPLRQMTPICEEYGNKLFASDELMQFFYTAYTYVIEAGYEHEITWCDGIQFKDVTIDDFFREYVWVVLNSGMREQAARTIFVRYMETMDTNVIRHAGKRKAIEHVLKHCEMYYDRLLNADNKVEWLVTLPWIGHITKHHLARNLGIDTVKPDRHLVRLAGRFGYKTPMEMCRAIQKKTSMRIGVIDIILWRYCNLRPSGQQSLLKQR